MSWNPDQYERFRRERSEPHAELLAMIAPQEGMKAIDLGCGTGELTLAVHTRFGCRTTLGLDNSPTMLEKSARVEAPGLSFRLADATALEGQYDLIHSNAALQWLPDHPALFRRLASHLGAGGQLAVQMPANYDHPSHEIARQLSEEMGGPALNRSVLAPEDYSRLLYSLGLAEQKVRLQVFAHLLEGPEEVVEWVKGTLLTWYRERLGEPLYAEFLERYRQRLLAALPDERPFLYPFKRLFLWARNSPAPRSSS